MSNYYYPIISFLWHCYCYAYGHHHHYAIYYNHKQVTTVNKINTDGNKNYNSNSSIIATERSLFHKHNRFNHHHYIHYHHHDDLP